jgi:hypothetical protein
MVAMALLLGGRSADPPTAWSLQPSRLAVISRVGSLGVRVMGHVRGSVWLGRSLSRLLVAVWVNLLPASLVPRGQGASGLGASERFLGACTR